MSRLFFILLITVKFVSSQQHDKITDLYSSKFTEQIETCRITNSAKMIKHCYVELIFTEFSKDTMYFCRCRMDSEFDSGIWTFTIQFKNQLIPLTNENFTVYQSTVVSPRPGNAFFAKTGEFIRVYMDKPSHQKSAKCYAHYKGQLIWNSDQSTNDIGFESYGTCGIQLLVQENREGEWKLYQDFGYKRKIANFTVVIDKKNLNISEKDMPDFMIGEDTQITASVNTHLNVSAKRPAGEIHECIVNQSTEAIFSYTYSTEELKFCNLNIPNLTSKYYGQWSIVSVFRNNKNLRNSVKLLHHINIYKTIKEELLEYEYKNVVLHIGAEIQVAFRDSVYENDDYNSCKLIHKTSKKVYDFSDGHHPTDGIELVNVIRCKVRIFIVNNNRYGRWILEDRFNSNLRRAYFTISKSDGSEF